MSAAGLAAVAIGAVVGAWVRWALGLWLNTAERAMPYGTLIANLGGGLLIGLYYAYLNDPRRHLREPA